MTREGIIEVPLPEGVDASREERERLEALLRVIVELRFDGPGGWQETRDRLESEGWTVRWRLGWVAEARRGREFEQGIGRTRDEAFAELNMLTQLDTVSGYSS
jgi:hypothetical protein